MHVRVTVALALLSAVAVTPTRGQDAVPDSVTPERVVAGSSLFNGGSCVVCHAVGGRGSGTRAPDLSDVEWLHSEGDFDGIRRTIMWGVSRDRMKALTPRPFEMNPAGGMALTREQLQALTAYVWTLSRPETHELVAQQRDVIDLVRAGRVEEAVTILRRAHRSEPSRELLAENAVNRLGYGFMPADPARARLLFELNVELHPDSWNVYDSLAESYMVSGDRQQAIRYYRRSLELNPNNRNAVDMLEQLDAGR